MDIQTILTIVAVTYFCFYKRFILFCNVDKWVCYNLCSFILVTKREQKIGKYNEEYSEISIELCFEKWYLRCQSLNYSI